MERTVAGAVRVQAVRPLPPGFRFHPTDEELVVQYLRRKALASPLPAAVIPVVPDAGKLDPWDLPGASEGEAYFFSLRQPPTSGGGVGRRRRAGGGYWKAAGKEKPVFLQGSSSACDGGGGGGGRQRQRLVGVKAALVFHRGTRPPSRTDWVMHEYRLAAAPAGGGAPEQRKKKSASHDSQSCVVRPGEWVVCRVFLKNRSRRPTAAGVGDIDGRASVVHPPLPPPSPSSSSSSSSCVIDVSDQEEVTTSQ